MDFSHYTDRAAAIAADLVNTRGSITGNEYLGDPATLRQWLAAHGLEVPKSIDRRDLEQVHALRARLREVFEADEESVIARLLNDLLAEAGAVPELTSHDGSGWHLHYLPGEPSIARRLMATSAMGLATVICEFGRDRLGVCSADECRDVFVDTSRNRSRRYCNETCSSRMNVAAYRARHRHSR